MRTLSEVRFDSPLTALEPFGRANWYWTYGDYTDLFYYELGLVLTTSEARFDSFEVYFRPSEGVYGKAHRFQPATLDLRVDAGRRIQLTGATLERDLLRLLGRPAEKDLVTEKSWCSFEIDGFTLESYSNPETGQLIELEVFAPENAAS